MAWHLKVVPEKTSIDFVSWRVPAFAFSIALFVITIGSLLTQGLNLGIDFKGGILIEVRSESAVDLGSLRQRMEGLGIGEVALQSLDEDRDVLIRVQQQETGEEGNRIAIAKVRDTLGEGFEYRRVEQVGPTVGAELLQTGLIATLLAVVGITLYVAFRFEWQFGVSALVATFHDVIITIGLFSVLGLEFNLTAVAALLTLAGYSINDTVVVFDRIRENLRKRKRSDLGTIVNLSVNEMLSRTILTSGTTLVAIMPLLIYGGPSLRNFSVALTWGILIGTFSSVYVAGSLLLYMRPVRAEPPSKAGQAEAEPA